MTIKGIEADLVIAPSRSFSLSLGGAYTDQNIDRLSVPAIGANSLTKEKVTLPTPKFTGTIAARWVLPVEPLDGQLVFNTDYYHSSERSEEHTSELQSLMRISYADFCLN